MPLSRISLDQQRTFTAVVNADGYAHAARSIAMPLTVRRLGLLPYTPVWHAMREYTEQRAADAADALWLVEHPPVYTLGLNAHTQHLRTNGAIPVIRCDRGGQVTYHGPGQVVVYVLLDLRRRGWGVKDVVLCLEQAVLDTLAAFGIAGARRVGAPGVYVESAKIAALGLRVRRGCSYHGLALNVDMDLAPFTHIDPCGYPGLAATDLKTLGVSTTLDAVSTHLLDALGRML